MEDRQVELLISENRALCRENENLHRRVEHLRKELIKQVQSATNKMNAVAGAIYEFEISKTITLSPGVYKLACGKIFKYKDPQTSSLKSSIISK